MAQYINKDTYVGDTGKQLKEIEQITTNTNNITVLQKNMNYSTSEIDTGKKWIDGKTIYRKVIKVQPNDKNFYSSPGISSIDTLISVNGLVKRANSDYRNPLPCNYTGWEIYFYDYSPSHYVIKFSDNQWNAGIDYILLIWEYTK